jgi:hypothetical protein
MYEFLSVAASGETATSAEPSTSANTSKTFGRRPEGIIHAP